LSIYKNQTADDLLILNADSKTLMDNLSEHKSRSFYFSTVSEQVNGCYLSGNQIFFNQDGELKFTCSVSDINLKGEHNYSNAMAVITAAKIFGCRDESIKSALKTFKGVEHRLEFVREIDGVVFINDSKATNVDSVWYALKSFDNPIFLILGGQDKGNDYSKIENLVTEKVKKIYAIGTSADKIFNYFHAHVKVEIKKNLTEVINTVNSEARSGDVVLLSPACASFDMFDNYEHRGRVFKEAVNKL
jgi:UDP-N-acetylmuramoylalanine--D-glutamate ligase